VTELNDTVTSFEGISEHYAMTMT